MRRPSAAVLLGLAVAAAPLDLPAATRVTGLVGVATDYVFRGRTHSRGEAALQAGVGVQHDSGMFGGLWASRVDYSPATSGEYELDAVLGYGRDVHRDWWTDVVLRRYSFPRSRDLVDYDYTEVSAGVRYRELLSLAASYAPDWSGFASGAIVHDRALRSVETGVRWPVRSGFSIVAGLGWLQLSGQGGGEYVFGSAGVAYEIRRVTIDVGYYDTDSGARRLFPRTAREGDWAAALIYRF